MKKLQKSLCLILGLLCPMFASCVDSKNPLSDPQQSVVDPGLLGAWRRESKEGYQMYYVEKAGEKFPAGMLRITSTVHTKYYETRRQDGAYILVFTSNLKNNHYLNVIYKWKGTNSYPPWEPSLDEGYFIFKYDIHDDKLTLTPMDHGEKIKAIKTGKIKGTIYETRAGRTIMITDTTENLARFIADADPDKLFTAKETANPFNMTLERVK